MLSEPTIRLARDWLERARLRAWKKPKNALYSDSELSSDDGYSQPVALRPESARLMLTWLGGARARRAEAGSDRALGDSTMSSGDDSDDLGGGARFDAPVVVSEKAQSLAKWWLENTRRRNEEERAGAVALVPDDDEASDDDFEESSDDSFPTSPAGDAGGDAPGGDRSLVLRDVDSSDSDPGTGSSGSSALDSSD